MAQVMGGPPGNVVQPVQPGTNVSAQRGAIAGTGLVHPEPWKAFIRTWSLPQLPSFSLPTVSGGGPFTIAVGLAQESDTAFAIRPSHVKAIGLASETDTAFQIKPSHVKAIGLAAESDTAFAISHRKSRTIGLASESDTAFVIRPSHVKSIGLAAESDTAFQIKASKKKLIGIALESDSAFSITRASNAHIIAVGMALEVDTAFVITGRTSTVTYPQNNATKWVEVKMHRNPHRPRGLQDRRGW